MFRYLVGRLLTAIPVLAFVAIFIFSLVHLAPGDPAILVAGDAATPEHVAAIREKMNLDQPLWTQFGQWTLGLLRGDLGTSIFSNQPVGKLILQRMEPTIMLALCTLLISVGVAIPVGVLAAHKARSWIDKGAMLASVAGFSIPVFVVGYGLMYVFAIQLRWFPVQGYKPLSDGILACLHSLTLPSIALATVFAALIARVTRASMLEILSEDYIRTARAKGLSALRVLVVHALKNAGVPITTVVGIAFAILVGGVVVTESVFNLPGLGRLTVDAVLRRDYPVVQGVILVFSVVLVLINVLVDLSYPLFDPRIKV